MTDKILIDRSVVEQALEAFDVATTPLARDRQEVLRAQAALRAALEQPVEQEPAIYPEEAFDMGLEAIPYYTHPQPPRQPLTCNSCKGLGRVYRGCNEWAACVHCNTTGIGGES